MVNRKTNVKRKVVAIVILVVLGLIIVLGVFQNNVLTPPPPPPQKRTAAEYYEAYDPVLRDYEYRKPDAANGGSHENSSVLIIYSLTFKLKAKLGDAHEVNVNGWGTEMDPFYVEVILKGQAEVVDLESPRPWGYKSDKVEGNFPLEVNIASQEAEGDITVYI